MLSQTHYSGWMHIEDLSIPTLREVHLQVEYLCHHFIKTLKEMYSTTNFIHICDPAVKLKQKVIINYTHNFNMFCDR